ncbi:MAG: DUF924 domain-containing protein [Myxococcales bacterium]|nr:DUF924 domain-containing protein [Myxococcales bacterium]MCB9533626.1 DUF924 domain-containing protein [Myxococcales bacterium]
MTPDDVLSTWFGPTGAPDYPQRNDKLWWGKDPAADAALRARFGETLDAAGRGELEPWLETPRGHLAVVILLDQLSRNIHRDTAQMYALDDEAVDLVLRGLEAGVDRALAPRERVFFYMPLMHAESVPLQRKCVRLFRRLADGVPEGERAAYSGNVDFAIRHLEIVERFGRFPHRNAILGRVSTDDEAQFLTQPGSSF